MRDRLLLRAFAIVAALTFALGASAAVEYDFVYGNLQYVITSPTTAKLVGHSATFPSGAYYIPDEANGYRITAIGDRALYGCDEITYLSIGSNVETIEEYAFYGCSGLTGIVIPNSLRTIERYAFTHCSGLSSIPIPNGVTTIPNCCFLDCSGMTSVTIPNTVTTIESSAFYQCSSLTSVTIPNSVVNLEGNIFNKCSSLTTVVIGENCLFYVGNGWPANIFANCPNLSSVTSLSRTPTTCAANIFDQTVYSNATLKVPKGCTSTYQSTNYWNNFSNIQELNYSFESGGIYYNITGSTTVEVTFRDTGYNTYSGNVDIPETVTYGGTTYTVTAIGNNAFRGCMNLTGVTIPNTVTNIGSFAFYQCYDLTSVDIPTSVTRLEIDVFGCTGLTSVTIPNTVTYMGSEAFYKCSQLSQIKLSNAITSIAQRTFDGCTSLTEITIPASVTSIAIVAFRNCTALTRVTCLSDVPCTLHDEGFDSSTYSNATLTVPSGSASDYQAASGWLNFTHFEEFTPLGPVLNVGGATIDFTSSDDYLWIAVTEGDRTYAKSGNAGVHSSTSTLNAAVTVNGACILHFDFKAWGESSSSGTTHYDKCIFAVDGVQQFCYGARQNDWETYEVELAAGVHTLEWAYSKDSSVNPLGDYFAIDNVGLRNNLDPALNVNGGTIHFLTEGNYPWLVMSDGNRLYAQSGNKGVASSSSEVTATVHVDQASLLSFDFKAWGESNSSGTTHYDKCIFSIDGVEQFRYGARQNDWETYEVDLAAGDHTLKWTYSKDNTVNPLGDYFAIDNVRLASTVLLGDVNGDTQVNITDAIMLINFISNGNVNINPDAANVNGDTQVNITDAIMLINYISNGHW